MVLKPNFLHLFVCFRVFFLWLNFLFLIALEQFYLELFGRTTTPFYYLLLSIRNTRRSWNIIFDTYLFVLELYFWMLQRNFIWSCLSILPPLPASVSDCPTRDGQKKMNHKVIFFCHFETWNCIFDPTYFHFSYGPPNAKCFN